MFKLWTTAVLGSTLILAACNTLPMGTDNPHQQPEQPTRTLNNTAWQLSQLNGKAVQVDAAQSNRPHISFSSDLRISGATGCNRLMGQAKVSGHSISLAPLATTKMACMGDNLEAPFVAALNTAQQYQVKDNQLTLKDASGKVLAVLIATSKPTP